MHGNSRRLPQDIVRPITPFEFIVVKTRDVILPPIGRIQRCEHGHIEVRTQSWRAKKPGHESDKLDAGNWFMENTDSVSSWISV